MNKKSIFLGFTSTALFALSSVTHGAIISENQYVTLNDSVGSSGTFLGSYSSAYSVTDAGVSGNPTVATGTVESSVWLENDNTLTFGWRVINDATSSVAIDLFAIGGGVFDNSIFDISEVNDPASVSFDYANLTSSGTLFVGFLGSSSPIGAGETSELLIADTDFTQYTLGSSNGVYGIVSNAQYGGFTAYVPQATSAVPVPPAAWLFLSALGGLAGVRARGKSQ